jgi:hypothetical protein
VNFTLSAFCRSSSEHGGSGIYIKEGLETQEIRYFVDVNDERNLNVINRTA